MKLGIVVPNNTLRSQIEKVLPQLHVPVVMVVSDISGAVENAKRVIREGARIIISRGGVLSVIREAGLGIPVFDIPLTGFDVAMLLDMARQYGKQVGVITTYEELISGILKIAPLLNIESVVRRASSSRDIEAALDDMESRSINVVIGGTHTAKLAQRRNIMVYPSFSSTETIEKTLKDAESLLKTIQRESGDRIRQEIILNAISDALISFDTNGNVIFCNNTASSLCGKGKRLEEFVQKSGLRETVLSERRMHNELVIFGKEQFVCTVRPVTLKEQNFGAVAVLSPISNVQNIEQNIRKKMYNLGHVARYGFPDIVARSPKMDKVIEMAQKFAKSSATVLIYGESGVGKELFAHGLHKESARRNGPFIAINCTALPESLLGSELFGYDEGAFTGARRGGKPGLFEMAHSGTLFLDEIGDVPLSLQAQLLRVLEEKCVRRLGQESFVPVDVRVLCATNRNLAQLVAQGLFRQDLFYRLNVLHLSIPPLRERPEDIAPLIRSILKSIVKSEDYSSIQVEPSALARLQHYDFPGNVRELRNIVERLVTLDPEANITERRINAILDEFSEQQRPAPQEPVLPEKEGTTGSSALGDGLLEQEGLGLVARVLRETGGNRKETARRLGISTTTLWRKLKKLNMIR